MIITRVPFRISFAGGGTDLPSFYLNEDGRVINATIDPLNIDIYNMFY